MYVLVAGVILAAVTFLSSGTIQPIIPTHKGEI